MTRTRFQIRNLRPEDVTELMTLPRAEGREMGEEAEVLSWLQVDPRGLFVALDTEDDSIVGCCCGIALSDDHGYIGMFVVKSEYRGGGLGRLLWNAAINRLDGRNISLSSADKMLSFYRDKSGFSQRASWTVGLYKATTISLPANPAFGCCTVFVDPEGPLVDAVVEYDSGLHGYDRSAIVRATIQESGTVTLLASRGYACMKTSLQGSWLLAPVYADDFETAFGLVHDLLSLLSPSQRLQGAVAKLVSSNTAADQLFGTFGFCKTSYQLHRLFTQEVFSIPEDNVYALQSSVFCTE